MIDLASSATRDGSTTGSSLPRPHTAAAASTANPSGKIDMFRKSSCSDGSRSSYPQATAARQLRCRATAVLQPPRSVDSRSSRRSASSASDRTRTNRAASSIASGNPSTFAHIRPTVSASWSAKQKAGLAARARSVNSLTASDLRCSIALPAASGAGSDRPARVYTTSPGSRNASRLVTSTCNLGWRGRHWDRTRLHSSSTWSQSFSTTSRSGGCRMPRSRGDAPAVRRRASLSGTEPSVSPSRPSAPPSSPRSMTSVLPARIRCSASSIAMRVLPTPGGPTSVSNCAARISRLTSTMSFSRPTKLASRCGNPSGSIRPTTVVMDRSR
jgi:hypothetical protein